MAQQHWRTVKKYPDGVDVVVENTSPISVEFTAPDGTRVRVASNYGLSVSVQAPPPTEKKHRVTGSVLGVLVSEDFDSEFEARERERLLSSGVREDVSLTVEEVEVPL